MSDAEPSFRVVRGTPTAEELAALVGVIVARSHPVATTAPPPAPSTWVRSARPTAGIDWRGPGAWRTSGLPR
ncbi:acyl-CoA carboxylase subunit epsilon [Micromonospora sp. NPDC049679]|uniref:acyl-CoA carboxylase subunit epsilon n=1 Tax=Micromonospora sp. NPDC049679 TaxID=3155920 RepID=UPI0033F2EBB6